MIRLARPEMDAHSPEGLRKARLMSGSDSRSSVLPDSELAWKRRSMPLPSCLSVSLEDWEMTKHGRGRCSQRGRKKVTLAARAMQRETSRPLDAILVVIMQNLDFSTNFTRSSTFSERAGSWRFFWIYGSAGLSPVSVLLNDILMGFVFRFCFA